MAITYGIDDREKAENKLILLYLLNKLKIGSTDLHITKLIRENNLMNYFLLQELLSELKSTGLITQQLTDDDRLVYLITEKGKEMLTLLQGVIPYGLRSAIDRLIPGVKQEIRKHAQITAEYTPASDTCFLVTCSAGEGEMENESDLIKIDLTVGSKEDAYNVTNNWKNHSAQIYGEIIKSLLKNRS